LFFLGRILLRCPASTHQKQKGPTEVKFRSGLPTSKSSSEYPSAVLSIWFAYCQHWIGRKTASVIMCLSVTDGLNSPEIKTTSLPKSPVSLAILDALSAVESGGLSIKAGKHSAKSQRVSLPELSAPKGKAVPTAFLIGTSYCGTIRETRQLWNRGFVDGGNDFRVTVPCTVWRSESEMPRQHGISLSTLENKISRHRSRLVAGGATSTGNESWNPVTRTAQGKSITVNSCGSQDCIGAELGHAPEMGKGSLGFFREKLSLKFWRGFDRKSTTSGANVTGLGIRGDCCACFAAPLLAVQYERLFVLTFTPTLGALAAVLLWRAWKHINNSQR